MTMSLLRRALGRQQRNPTKSIRTLVGLWLYYRLIGDMRRADKVPNDTKDVDAVAMLDPLLRILVEHRFGKTYEQDDVVFFSRRVRQNWSDAVPPPELELLQAIILEARTTTPEKVGRHQMTMALSYLAIMKEIIRDLKYSEALTAKAICLAEDVTFAWGYSPTLRRFARPRRLSAAGEVDVVSLPYLRDPKQRHPALQLLIRITVFGGAIIGGTLISIVVLAKLLT